jgi:tetratricopeptide (TPR) repeat protein
LVELDIKKIQTAIRDNNVEISINGLIDLADFYRVVQLDAIQADSISQLAVVRSQQTSNTDLQAEALLSLARNCHASNQPAAIQKFQSFIANQGRNISVSTSFELKVQLANLYLKSGQVDEAMSTFINLDLSATIQPDAYHQYLLLLGEVHNERKKPLDAIQSFNKTLLFAKQHKSPRLMYISYFRLCEFFLQNRLFEQAINYTDSLRKIGNKEPEILNVFDSLHIECLSLEADAGLNKSLTEKGERLLRDAKKYKFGFIKDVTLSLMRRYYMSVNDNQKICDLYCKKMPEELKRLEDDNPILYHRLSALIAEYENNSDSAEHHWNIANNLMNEYQYSATERSNFYKRWGEYYLRQGKQVQAIEAIQQALSFALRANYFPFIIESSSLLDSVLFAKGDISNAYTALKLNKKYIDSSNMILQKDKLEDIHNVLQNQLKEIDQQSAIEEKKMKTKRDLAIIVFFIFLALCGLFMISKYSVSKSVLSMFSYITFVMVFEFIILLLHTPIHYLFHDNLIGTLAAQVVVIAILLPIHHATDYRVLQYLIKKDRVKHDSIPLRVRIQNMVTSFKSWLNIHPDHTHDHDASGKTDS